jgi:hypothetical protein
MSGVSSNYFEWFGGNNFGTWGSHDTATAYHGSSALNHVALPNEPKYSHLGRLHKLLQQYSCSKPRRSLYRSAACPSSLTAAASPPERPPLRACRRTITRRRTSGQRSGLAPVRPG